MTPADLHRLDGIPLQGDSPVFRAPWEAQAFALAVSLQQQGVFTLNEWAEQLGRSIKAAQAAGDADLGDTYYRHWLSALEALLAVKGCVSQDVLGRQLDVAREEFRRQHPAAPHHDHDGHHHHH
jgi:nitrile hydratase accessory protein